MLMKTKLISALFCALTATAGNAAPTVNAEVLPTIVIKQHTVAKTFPVESLVEAKRALEEFQQQGDVRAKTGHKARPGQTSKKGHGGYRVAGFLGDEP